MPQELKKLWKKAVKDLKKHPKKYFKPRLTFCDIGIMNKLKRELDEVVILNKIPTKKISAQRLRKCGFCEGKGKIIKAYAYDVQKNGWKYGKVNKEKIRCPDCNGNGYIA